VHADPSVTGGETRTRDVPLGPLPRRESDQGASARVIEGAAATMVGASWSGAEPDVLRVRGRASGGDWTAWFPLETAEDPEDGTALGAAEPAWLGAADEIELVALRDGEDVSAELTAHVLTTSPRDLEKDGASSAALERMSTRAAGAGDAVELGPGAPAIVTRSAWGADESLVGSVSSASELRAVVVHHTAGSNSYAKADAPQLLRGILSYHTTTLGWADIGYNLLVDRYGTIYEGRHGGLHKHIVGAHAYGFNTFSCGISVMGTFTSSAPPSAAISAVQKAAAWKLLGAFRTNASQQFDWVSTVTGGGSLYDEGETAHLRRIFGHRDVNATECPGNAFYPKLSGMRSATTSAISSAWRLHLDAFASPGGEDPGHRHPARPRRGGLLRHAADQGLRHLQRLRREGRPGDPVPHLDDGLGAPPRRLAGRGRPAHPGLLPRPGRERGRRGDVHTLLIPGPSGPGVRGLGALAGDRVRRVGGAGADRPGDIARAHPLRREAADERVARAGGVDGPHHRGADELASALVDPEGAARAEGDDDVADARAEQDLGGALDVLEAVDRHPREQLELRLVGNQELDPGDRGEVQVRGGGRRVQQHGDAQLGAQGHRGRDGLQGDLQLQDDQLAPPRSHPGRPRRPPA
jgi:hypothetical protein